MNKRNIIYIIIFILILLIILQNKRIILDNGKVTLKDMEEHIQGDNINKIIEELNKSHTNYAEYIQTSKEAIAKVITSEGVSTSSEDTLETITTNIAKILQAKTSNATATADNITEGKTAWVNGELITGNGADYELAKKSFSNKMTWSTGFLGTRDGDMTSIDLFTLQNNNYDKLTLQINVNYTYFYANLVVNGSIITTFTPTYDGDKITFDISEYKGQSVGINLRSKNLARGATNGYYELSF